MTKLKRLPLKKEHTACLAEYGLQNVPISACCCLRFAAGEDVLREGHPIGWIAIVVEGNAKVCRTAPNGKSLILCYNISHGLIGEIELMTRQVNATSSVKAVTELECVAVSYQNCLAELKTNLVFLNKLGTELAEKLTASSDNFTSTALCTGEQRLCAYVIQNSHRGLFCDTLTDVSCSGGMSYRHMLSESLNKTRSFLPQAKQISFYSYTEVGVSSQVSSHGSPVCIPGLPCRL